MKQLPPPSVNIARLLVKNADLFPFKRSVVVANCRNSSGQIYYSHVTFRQLNERCDQLAWGLTKLGIGPGTKTLLMIKPGIDFFALTFALFKMGSIPILIDPGMGLMPLLRSIRSAKPEALVGIPLAHLISIFFGKYFRTVKFRLTLGTRLFWGGATVKGLIKEHSNKPFPIVPTDPNGQAAILFTSGSTGPAKGVHYQYRMFDAQVTYLKEHFGIGPNDIDLPTFPLFALYGPALGMTTIIPQMDPSRPAKVNPLNIIDPIHDQGVTNMFASPAVLQRVGEFGRTHQVQLPTLKRVLSAGAPANNQTIQLFQNLLPLDGEIFTPYGATEALPISSIGSHEILATTALETAKGNGVCVGNPLKDVQLKIIQISDHPIATWDDRLVVPNGTIGEIVVKGPIVTESYDHNVDANRYAKIQDAQQIWHRMGDLGWVDPQNRVWFCGRKAHRVNTLERVHFSIPCEAIFNQHAGVRRSALIGIEKNNRSMPAICIELSASGKKSNKSELIKELKALARLHPHTQAIETFLFHPSFPVDVRHNSKIAREKLSRWGQQKLSGNN